MWSALMEHILAHAPMLGLGIVMIRTLRVMVAGILGVMALRRAKPEDIPDIIRAFSQWWRRR